MNVCGKFGCQNKGLFNCPCHCICFCSKECQKEMWEFHKRTCKFSLDSVPLPERCLLLDKHRFFQLYNVLDSLERMNRIIPPAENYVATDDVAKKTEKSEEEKKRRPVFDKFGVVLMRFDNLCKSNRMVGFTVVPGTTEATVGGDTFEELYKEKFPLPLVVRSMSYGKSLAFCMTICAVIEILVAHAGYSCLHGCEPLANYFLAKGRIRTLCPRLVLHDIDKQPDERSASDVDVYCILFIQDPSYHFEQHAVVGLERAARLEEQSQLIKENFFELHQKWKDVRDKSFVEKPAEWTQKTAELFARFGKTCIFVAPGAGEHDETLHSNNLSVGVPNWFQLTEIYSSADMQRFKCDSTIENFISLKSRSILVDLLGKEAATKAVLASMKASLATTRVEPDAEKQIMSTNSNTEIK